MSAYSTLKFTRTAAIDYIQKEMRNMSNDE